MKNRFLPLALLLACVMLLAACGKTEAPAAAQPAPVQPAASSASQPAEIEEPAEALEITDSGNGESTIFFGLNDTVEYEGLCEMSGLYSEVLDDEAKAQGWYYYYTDTDESPANVIVWEPAAGNYTTLEVLFTVKNTSGVPQTFGDRIIAQMFYMESDDAMTDYYNGTVFQQNPGQTEADGTVIMWSTKPVQIAPGESANVSFRFDIPKEVYDRVYAQASGEDTGIRETCEFNFGDGTSYVIDLVEVLILASRYEY